jgi:hypothetical protein
MLRASGKDTQTEIDIRMATGDADSVDGGITHGGLLRRYAEAILNREPAANAHRELEEARNACIATLGTDATIQAASIVASFDGINRVADATGIRLDRETMAGGAEEIIRRLGYEELGSARA